MAFWGTPLPDSLGYVKVPCIPEFQKRTTVDVREVIPRLWFGLECLGFIRRVGLVNTSVSHPPSGAGVIRLTMRGGPENVLNNIQVILSSASSEPDLDVTWYMWGEY